MKQLLVILICVLLTSSNIDAQMNSGSRFIAGTNSLSLEGYTHKMSESTAVPTKIFGMNLSTKAGYFIKNRIAVGGMIDYRYSRQRSEYISTFDSTKVVTTNASTTWLIGPLVRYYVEYGTIVPFAEMSVGIGKENSRYESTGNAPSKYKSPVFALNAGVGANYFLNESIALEGMVSYSFTRTKHTNPTGPDTVYLNNGIGATVGIVIYFGTI